MFIYEKISSSGIIRYRADIPDDTIHCASLHDVSPLHLGDKYNPNCGWCWINAPHTEEAHNAKLAQVE